MSELPELNNKKLLSIDYDYLLRLFFQQFWAFSEFMNDTNGVVPTCNYADFILWSMKQEINKLYGDQIRPWTLQEMNGNGKDNSTSGNDASL